MAQDNFVMKHSEEEVQGSLITLIKFLILVLLHLAKIKHWFRAGYILIRVLKRIEHICVLPENLKCEIIQALTFLKLILI